MRGTAALELELELAVGEAGCSANVGGTASSSSASLTEHTLSRLTDRARVTERGRSCAVSGACSTRRMMRSTSSMSHTLSAGLGAASRLDDMGGSSSLAALLSLLVAAATTVGAALPSSSSPSLPLSLSLSLLLTLLLPPSAAPPGPLGPPALSTAPAVPSPVGCACTTGTCSVMSALKRLPMPRIPISTDTALPRASASARAAAVSDLVPPTSCSLRSASMK
mmetsp:Transcript_29507/g.96356  ORF Transcript_29507/g.96356 Transcript_29507/m.96356 type:complete len:223 (+) Transcript_29507:608-1276(+)